MTPSEKLNGFLNDAGIFYLSTVEGDKPRCRPLGLHVMIDGVLYFGIGDFKEVYKQLVKNPNAEIVALKGSTWCRANGKAVFEKDFRIADIVLENSPLKGMYEANGWKMMIFHMEETTVQYIDMMTVKETDNI